MSSMYQPMTGISLGALYQDAGRTTAEQTIPSEANGPARAMAHNTGTRVAGMVGVELPVLLALGVLAVVLVRYYD